MDIPMEVDNKSKNLKSSIKDFFKRNKDKLLDYGLFPTLIATSFPAAGYYLASRKNMGTKVKNVVVGGILSFCLSIGVCLYQMRDMAKFETERVSITHNYDSTPANTPLEGFSTKDLFFHLPVILTTNYGTFDIIKNPLNKEITTVTVKGRDGDDNFEGGYEFDGFMNPSKISGEMLNNPFRLFLDTTAVGGQKGRELYGRLCAQIFEQERQYFD